MDRPRSPAHPHVRLAAMGAVLCAMVLGLLGSPLTTTQAHAADCTQPMECVRFTPATDQGRLNLYGQQANGVTVLDWNDENGGSGQKNQEWKLKKVNDDGSFQLQNGNSGSCLSVDLPNFNPWIVAGRECANQKSQMWYLEPRPSDDGFTLRNVAQERCLSDSGTRLWQYKTVMMNDCGGADSVKWTVSDRAFSDPTAQLGAYKGLAAQHALTKCLADANYCKFKAEKQGDPHSGPGKCMKVYAKSDKGGAVTFTEEETSSYSSTVGSSVNTGFEIGASVKFGDLGFETKFSQNWGSNISKTDTSTTRYASTVTQQRAPGEYAWMIYRPLLSSQNGTYTFDSGSWTEWTYTGTFDVALGSGAADKAAGLWEPGSGPALPDDCKQTSAVTAPAV